MRVGRCTCGHGDRCVVRFGTALESSVSAMWINPVGGLVGTDDGVNYHQRVVAVSAVGFAASLLCVGKNAYQHGATAFAGFPTARALCTVPPVLWPVLASLFDAQSACFPLTVFVSFDSTPHEGSRARGRPIGAGARKYFGRGPKRVRARPPSATTDSTAAPHRGHGRPESGAPGA